MESLLNCLALLLRHCCVPAGDEGASTSGAAAAPPPSTASPGSVVWEGADESQPTTSIQLRLADGSRMVAKFNLTHTVADIRRWGGGVGCW